MSIAEKLITIAENEQKVYDKGVNDGNILKNSTKWGYMFYDGYRLELLPYLKYEDTSNVTDMSYAFCYAFDTADKVKTIPKLDTSNVTTFEECFSQCKHLKTFPDFNLSNSTNCYRMFMTCVRLTDVPDLDLGKVETVNSMFYQNSGLAHVGHLDTRNCTNFSSMFYYASWVAEIKSINLTNATTASNMFYRCERLKNITFVGSIPVSLNLSASTLITYESLMSAINALTDRTGEETVTILTLGTTNLAKITDEEKAIATEKGWTLA